MSAVFVDTSCLVAITFGEAGAVALARRLERFDALHASNLLEAELRAACRRDQREMEPSGLADLLWVIPSRPLGPEIARVLEAGCVRGADCWHLATALYLAPDADLPFITLDAGQAKVARALGFAA